MTDYREANLQTILANDNDEIKLLIKDEKQLNSVYDFVIRQFEKVKITFITQTDRYLDDSSLTLHTKGASLRIRQSSPQQLALNLKIKKQDSITGTDAIYKRREIKHNLTDVQFSSLMSNASIDIIVPDFCSLLRSVLSLPLIILEKKFDITTSRTEVLVENGESEFRFHFDTMVYTIVDKEITFYEMEIKVSTSEYQDLNILQNLLNEFNLVRWGKSKYDRGIYLYKRENSKATNIPMDEIATKFFLSTEQVDMLKKHSRILQDVYRDYILHKPYFSREVKLIHNELQVLLIDDEQWDSTTIERKHVHSIRPRVKIADHVIVKIIRREDKAREDGVHKYFNSDNTIGNAKYGQLTVDNYKSILTDLIGLRVLHLFKSNWLEIDEQLTDLYKEKIVEKRFYVRKGDEIQGQDELKSEVESRRFTFIEKESGYRSAHYLIKRDVYVDSGEVFTAYAEIQVRTVFEEAWGEVDHEIRYPHYDKDININHFLKTFNRIAGSADEMASFIKIYRDSLLNRRCVLR
ncbi:MAG: CYTH domain-containing protein [Nitrospirae bacterium]|nr:CYTH domain-containing protein [Nitrospirota bacterium]